MSNGFSEFERGVSVEPFHLQPVRVAQAGGSSAKKKAVREILTGIRTAHKAGNGSILLSRIVKLAGFTPPPELLKRDTVQLKKTGAQTGTFTNAGPAVEFDQEIKGFTVEVMIPGQVKGTYRLHSDGGVSLSFEKGRTVKAKVFAGSITLLRVTASETQYETKVDAKGVLIALKGMIEGPHSIK